MKITVSDVHSLVEGLNVLMDREISTSVAFTVQRNFKMLEEEVKNSDAVRKKIIEKYKEKDNEDGTIKLKKDKVETFNKEVKELMEQEVDVELKKINLADLGDAIKPRVLMQLSTIIEEEE